MRSAALRAEQVEIKTTTSTQSGDMLQKAADFVHAYLLGFEVGPAQRGLGQRVLSRMSQPSACREVSMGWRLGKLRLLLPPRRAWAPW